MNSRKFSIITGFIFLAVLSRILPHPYNFTPLGAVALFGAAYFTDKKWAIVIPLLPMWVSDMILNNIFYREFFDGFTLLSSGMIPVYGSLILIALLGLKTLKQVTFLRVFSSALAASVIFFVVTNLAVWYADPVYPLSVEGLVACFTAAIPFFHNTVAGDLVYCSVLFGAFEYAKLKIPSLRESTLDHL